MSFLLSADHVAALLATGALCTLVAAAARARPGPWVRAFSRTLALVLIASFAAYQVVTLLEGSYSLDFDLPLQLTDAATVAATLALWTRRPLPFELTYFWGLSASLQAVLTPNLGPEDGFLSFIYWQFFLTHSGVVLAAVGNLLTGGNYMFLRHRPETASLLDVMGPWPWYILTGAGLALALFTLLDAPFWRRRRRVAPFV